MGFKKKSTAKAEDKKGKDAKPEVKRNFLGGGWINDGKHGVFHSLQLNKEKLGELEEDKYGNIRITVAERKEEDEKSGMNLMVYESIPFKSENPK